jgi:hypothetical protein
MSKRLLMIAILGLGGLVIPAHATFSFQSDVGSFDAAASALTLSAVTSFTVGNLVATTPFGYDDPSTSVDFLDTASNGVTARAFTVSGTALLQHAAGDLIEIILPSAVYAFAGTFVSSDSFNQNTCVEPGRSTFSTGTCDSATNVTGTNTFIGITSDVAFSTIWLGPGSGGDKLEIVNFQVGTPGSMEGTPEVGTMLALGSGLILLGLFRRQLRRFGSGS